MTTSEPFQAPSKMWMWLIAPFSTFSSTWTFIHAYQFVNIIDPSQDLRWRLIAGVILLFFSIYWVAGYRYLRWAVPKKNKLYQLAKKYPELFYKRHNRICIQATLLKQNQIDPGEFKGIQQKDFKEIINIL